MKLFFILDIDGVLTDGKFYYSEKGKIFKCFGADDSDALKLIKENLNVHFVTGDKRGFPISKKRVEDMGFEANLVSTIKRLEWIKERFDLNKVIYMGDGIFDHYVMKEVFYSIAPKNAHPFAKKTCNFITESRGSEGAVAEACLHLLDKFFEKYDMNKSLRFNTKSEKFGEWQA